MMTTPTEHVEPRTFLMMIGGGQNDFYFKRFPDEVREELRNLEVGQCWLNPDGESLVERVK